MQISLRAARVNAGLSQVDVANRLKRTKETISNWENGKVRISAEDFKALCDLYKISESAIFLPSKLT